MQNLFGSAHRMLYRLGMPTYQVIVHSVASFDEEGRGVDHQQRYHTVLARDTEEAIEIAERIDLGGRQLTGVDVASQYHENDEPSYDEPEYPAMVCSYDERD